MHVFSVRLSVSILVSLLIVALAPFSALAQSDNRTEKMAPQASGGGSFDEDPDDASSPAAVVVPPIAEAEETPSPELIPEPEEIPTPESVAEPATDVLPPCPDCPAGCLPRVLIESFKKGRLITENNCPAGCVPFEFVKALHDKPACTQESATKSASPPPKPDSTDAIRLVEKTRNRMILNQTAIALDKGEYQIVTYAFGAWMLQYGITDAFEFDFRVNLPVLNYGFSPGLRYRKAVSEHLHLGFGGSIWYDASYIDNVTGRFHLNFDAQMTYQIKMLSFNLGFWFLQPLFTHRSGGDHGESFDNYHLLAFSPGLRLEVHKIWSVQTEFIFPLLLNKDNGGVRVDEFMVLILYGARVHGDLLYGDFGFIFPVWDSFTDNLWKYMPLGIPYFSLGFSF